MVRAVETASSLPDVVKQANRQARADALKRWALGAGCVLLGVLVGALVQIASRSAEPVYGARVEAVELDVRALRDELRARDNEVHSLLSEHARELRALRGDGR